MRKGPPRRELFNQLEVIAQPGHQRAGDGDGAFQSIDRWLVTKLVAAGRQQTALGEDDFGAGVQEHKAAGDIGFLRLAGAEAGLTYHGRLLVAQVTANRDAAAKGAVRKGVPIKRRVAGGTNFRQHGLGDGHNLQDFVIPLCPSQVH